MIFFQNTITAIVCPAAFPGEISNCNHKANMVKDGKGFRDLGIREDCYLIPQSLNPSIVCNVFN
jgi:hypothetical protein